MVYLSDKKKIHKYHTLLIIVLVIFVIFLSGCTPFYIRFPYEFNSYWVCEDPYFSLMYYKDENGALCFEDKLELNGEVVEVDALFAPAYFIVYPEPNGYYDHDERMLYGTWEYQDEILVLYIEEDFIFDNQYEQLMFTQQGKSPEHNWGQTTLLIALIVLAIFVIWRIHKKRQADQAA